MRQLLLYLRYCYLCFLQLHSFLQLHCSQLRRRLLARPRLLSIFLCIFLPVFFSPITLSAPALYSAEYDARLQGFRARAEMSLEAAGTNEFHLKSTVRVRFLGKTITSINEESYFTWQNERALPTSYQFQQTGLGKKTHGADYFWTEQHVDTRVDESLLSLPLHAGVMDELSMYVEIKRQVALGVKDIFLDIIDEDEIKQYHYKVIGEENLTTALGNMNTLKVERIRAAESKRTTQLWFATDWDFLLVKLYQKNAKGKESELILRSASVNNVPL